MISHTLIDEDDPCCLYCQTRLDLAVDSKNVNGSYIYDVHILTCPSCSERFEMFMTGKIEEQVFCLAFLFSCLDLRVRFIYEEQMYYIGKAELQWPIAPNVPFVKVQPFHIDFSNKEKIYQKIKTYLLFS